MELPNFILQLKSLEILRFPLWPLNVKYLDWQLTCGISTLVNLRELDLSRRTRMKCEILIESGGIPMAINTFHDLHILDVTHCHEIQELPELPTSLTYLRLQATSLLNTLGLSKVTNLVNLLLCNGSDYEGKSKLIPGCDLRGIVNLSRLKWVELRVLNVPANPQLTYPSQPLEIVLGHLDSKPLVQLPSSNWRWRNLSTLEIYFCEVEDISLDGLSQLENLRVCGCEWLQRLSIPLELRKLRQATMESCQALVEIQVVDVSKSLEGLTVRYCESLTIISGLSYLKNLERFLIQSCGVLTNVEGLNGLESLKALSVYWCWSLKRLIDASGTKIPYDCIVLIQGCGYFIKDSIKDPMSMETTLLKHYRKDILQNTSKDSFTIRYHLGVKKPSDVWFWVCSWNRERKGRRRP
ncbi:protein SUPPRESSOR OF npr1-1, CONSTITUTIVE 1-like [Eucalyptus grandis]|uniref:protein SUPPRESSOR OF npr1-1, CONSTITUTIVE 1-like n=1 Tax=Eucalyptus grandis TaxID=71139 RepID=UPI00192ED5EC|nr:protein SUPPRESSOR OF npr1-1, CONSTITUTIVE 1-like [Eucalyptus grandis]XP_039164268.1 protein SUPPRESSOR OF npr1-1, CONSTITUTIVE 1-like [Eucalyptus grandis]